MSWPWQYHITHLDRRKYVKNSHKIELIPWIWRPIFFSLNHILLIIEVKNPRGNICRNSTAFFENVKFLIILELILFIIVAHRHFQYNYGYASVFIRLSQHSCLSNSELTSLYSGQIFPNITRRFLSDRKHVQHDIFII